jgi:hypothetical protein
MFVDSFYMFVDREVGHPGRKSDSAISEFSWMFSQIKQDRNAENGIIIGDRGFAQEDFLMTLFSGASTNREHYFNFCFLSTRFYVEQTFSW